MRGSTVTGTMAGPGRDAGTLSGKVRNGVKKPFMAFILQRGCFKLSEKE
jgi:hypothetical protein